MTPDTTFNAEAPPEARKAHRHFTSEIGDLYDPEPYIKWHRELAEVNLSNLQGMLKFEILSQGFKSSGDFDGMKVVIVKIKTVSGKELTLKYHDRGCLGGQWMTVGVGESLTRIVDLL